MTTFAPPVVCARCSCRLARDNSEKFCSPCAGRIGRERWLTPGGSVLPLLTASDLEVHGIKGLMERHGTTAEVLVPALMQSGVLPRQIRRYEPLVIRLVGLHGLSHSAAARNLRVTRWTVAAWRKRLGLDERGDGVVGRSPEKGTAAS
jgi:predicted alpha/beta-fold hydrolase